MHVKLLMKKKEKTFITKQIIKDMSIISTIKPSASFMKKQMNVAIVFTCIGAVGIFIGIGYLLILGIILMVMNSSQKKKDIIKVYENNLEIKFAPLASTRFIKYDELIELERASEKKIVIHYAKDDKRKKLRIPVQMIEPKELKEFLELVDSKIKPAA